MAKNNNKNQIRILADHLVKNATYLGVSESTIQNMLRAAFESESGNKIEVVHTSGLKKPFNKCNHYSMMPHQPLPNCTKFENKVSDYDILGALFGKQLRLNKGMKTIWNGRNIRANRYIEYIMNQLGHYRDRGQNKYYWRHALRLMQQPVFQLMAFNFVCHNWHREMSISHVNSVLRKVKELAKGFETEINLSRVYIEKSNGKWRPLGVPTVSWRVYLHMVNVLVVWFRTGTDHNQHAYKPKRGIHTAWLSLLSKIDKQNIYEFDLESFFPSVSLKGMKEILVAELGMPEAVAGWLQDLTRSLTMLEKVDKVPEDKDRKVLLNTSGNPNPNLPKNIRKLVSELLKYHSEKSRTEFLKSAELQAALPSGWSVYKETGVPQGAAISCGLATVNLHYIWQALGDELLMYADDGIVFPQTSNDVRVEDKNRGITQNQEKSGWVKRDGTWHKPLKFLGLEFIPATETSVAKIRAKTRSGSTKEFELSEQLMVYLLKERDLMLWAMKDQVEQVEGSEYTIFRQDARGERIWMDLSYSGPRIKPRNGEIREFQEKNSRLRAILNDLKNNVSFAEWIQRAAERFGNLSNPLTLLFEGYGLSELSKMYDCGPSAAQRYNDIRLTCTKKSWCYWRLGEHLYNMLSEFSPSNELQERVNKATIKHGIKSARLNKAGYSNWLIVTMTRQYKEAWLSNFISKEEKAPTGIGLIWSEIRSEMKDWLKRNSIDLFNSSTYATNYLLANDLQIPAQESDVRYCRWNRVFTEWLCPNKEKKLLENSKRRKEREFKRQFGIGVSEITPPPRE